MTLTVWCAAGLLPFGFYGISEFHTWETKKSYSCFGFPVQIMKRLLIHISKSTQSKSPKWPPKPNWGICVYTSTCKQQHKNAVFFCFGPVARKQTHHLLLSGLRQFENMQQCQGNNKTKPFPTTAFPSIWSSRWSSISYPYLSEDLTNFNFLIFSSQRFCSQWSTFLSHNKCSLTQGHAGPDTVILSQWAGSLNPSKVTSWTREP